MLERIINYKIHNFCPVKINALSEIRLGTIFLTISNIGQRYQVDHAWLKENIFNR